MDSAAGVIHEGWVSKWTNIMSSWRPRYFRIEPGVLMYSLAEDAPVKETFPLNKCRVRLCPGDTFRLEVETPDSGTLFLRAETIEEKSRWYAAIKQAQLSATRGRRGGPVAAARAVREMRAAQCFADSRADGASPVAHYASFDVRAEPARLSLGSEEKTKPMNTARSDVSETSGELSPLQCLVENCMACRQHVQVGVQLSMCTCACVYICR